MCAHARIQDSYCISLDPENVSTLTQYLIHLLHQTRAAIYLPIKYFRIFQRWLLGVSIPQQRFSFSSAICSFFEALLSLSLARACAYLLKSPLIDGQAEEPTIQEFRQRPPPPSSYTQVHHPPPVALGENREPTHIYTYIYGRGETFQLGQRGPFQLYYQPRAKNSIKNAMTPSPSLVCIAFLPRPASSTFVYNK